MLHDSTLVTCRYRIVCADRFGSPRWAREFPNLVTTIGKDLAINISFGATAKVAAWYVLLKGAGTAAAGDTMGSHAGWSEIVAYSEAARQAWNIGGGATGGSASNSGAPAVFTINASTTVGGAGMVSDSTKGASGGTLYSVGDFGASLPVVAADQVSVTVTLTA